VLVGGAKRVGVAEVDLVLAEVATLLRVLDRHAGGAMQLRMVRISGSTRAVPSSE